MTTANKKRMKEILELWVSSEGKSSRMRRLERRKELRQMVMEIENELDEIENSKDDL